MYLLLSPFYILTIVQCYLGYALTTLKIDEIGNKVYYCAKPIYWWIIILPILIGLLVFYYYAHMNAFQKYNPNYLKSHKIMTVETIDKKMDNTKNIQSNNENDSDSK